jgi:hypothetical protein
MNVECRESESERASERERERESARATMHTPAAALKDQDDAKDPKTVKT